MARTYGFSSATKATAAAAQTIVFPPSEIDAAGVVAFHVAMSVAGNAVSDITRVRVKANGTTIIDVSAAYLWAYQLRFHGRQDAAAAHGFTIPLYIGDARSDDEADACQFMPGASATVEVDTGAGAVVGAMMLGWTKTTVPAQYYPTLISQPMNVAASSVNARVGLGAPGFVQGIGLMNTTLAQARIVLSGIEVFNLTGAVYGGVVFNEGTVGAAQNLYGVSATNTDIFLKLNQGLPANPANSWMEISSGAGGAVTDDYALYSLVPCGQQGG